MLYKKNQAEKLEDSLFKQPTAEYRGASFWAWNTMLDQKELDRQMELSLIHISEPTRPY